MCVCMCVCVFVCVCVCLGGELAYERVVKNRLRRILKGNGRSEQKVGI